MLLGDDDCLVPSALATIAAALKRIPDAETVLWRWGGFIAPDWPAADIAGRARIPPYSMRIDVRSTVEVARLMYGFEAARLSEMTTWLPSVMRGAVRADVIERAWARTGMFCQPLSPDYGAAAQIVALTHEIYLLDMPLVILNHPSDSMVASMQGSTNVKASHFYDLVNDPVFRHTLVQTRYESNRPAICETMMRVREKYPEALGQIQFQLINFLEWYFTGLLESQSSGTVIDESLNELEAVITTLPSVEREELRSRMTLRRASVASASRRQLPNVRGKLMLALMQIAPKLPLGEKILGRIMPRFGLDVLAAEANLKTIKEFAFFVGRVMDESRRAGALA
jgi:hypothetical protein